MRKLDQAAEDVKARRDEAKTQFQATDQKVNQLTHSLIQVVKTLHELRQIGAKNLQ